MMHKLRIQVEDEDAEGWGREVATLVWLPTDVAGFRSVLNEMTHVLVAELVEEEVLER